MKNYKYVLQSDRNFFWKYNDIQIDQNTYLTENKDSLHDFIYNIFLTGVSKWVQIEECTIINIKLRTKRLI